MRLPTLEDASAHEVVGSAASFGNLGIRDPLCGCTGRANARHRVSLRLRRPRVIVLPGAGLHDSLRGRVN